MKTVQRTLRQAGAGRHTFVVAAVLVVCLQQVLLVWLLGVHKTPLWHANSLLGMLHAVLVSLSDALLLVLPALLIRVRWRWLQWPVLTLFTAWGVAQLMYFPTYGDLMPLSSFVLWQNLDSLVISSALSNWAPRDWLFVVPFAALLLADVLWLSRSRDDARALSTWRSFVCTILVVLALRVAGDAVAYWGLWNKSLTASEYLNDNYTHVKVSNAAYLADNGPVGYLLYCVAVEVAQHRDLTADDEQRVQRFVEQMPNYTDSTYCARRDNLVLIIVESLNSWVLDLRIDGREVTPVLNALCADTANNIVGRHMRRQVQNGGSSDGHFMYNTGLLPLEQRAVAMVYADAHYPTLVEALGRRSAIHICGDPPALWNTEATSRTYGYRQFVSANELQSLLRPNQWQWDKVILEAATRYLARMPQPFVAQVVTLGMHEPYGQPTVPESWISHSAQYTTRVRNYLERTAVFDRELGLFLQRLRQQGLYDKSLIVVVSDHSEYVDREPQGRPSIDPDGRDCLLLVLNSGQGQLIKQRFGQIDVYPTLLDLMGANGYWWKGLGNSLMRQPMVNSVAMTPSTGDGSGPMLDWQIEAWQVSRLMITSRWFDNHALDSH